MKRNKRLDKIVEQALEQSIKNGDIDRASVHKFTESFSRMNLEESIYALSNFVKGLKRVLSQNTLTIYSSTPIEKQIEDSIKTVISKKFSVMNVEKIIEPDLLGGIRLQIGDNVFDYSVKGKIYQVREAIAA